MAEPFLSSEEYDERAHRLYDEGDYDGALAVLKEGLALYPDAVDLYVGLGYARLAREEFAWARLAFERALLLEPDQEDALVGLGEVLLKFGERGRALAVFERVRELGSDDDLELALSVGRALYREGLYREAREAFARAAAARPDSAEAVAALAYAFHRLGDDVAARRHLRRALRLDPDLHEARIYLGHLLYDRGDWDGALREFERVPPRHHWDSLAVWRLMELLRALRGLETGDPRLEVWEARLAELEEPDDPVEELLAEIEAGVGEAEADPNQLELFEGEGTPGGGADSGIHQVRTGEGATFRGTWYEIVRQMRDHDGYSHETVAHYMRRLAERWRETAGLEVPLTDPEAFVRGAARVGLLRIEDE